MSALMNRLQSEIDENSQITFSWENITVRTKAQGRQISNWWNKKKVAQDKSQKTILRAVSGYVRPGELVAIMGASGAGKSTLLNALTYRNLSGLEMVSGARFANGVPVTPNSLTSVSAYIQQDDLFIGTLTVRETLEFHSKVRMDPSVNASDRKQRVEQVIKELGLTKCQDTLIGIQGRIKGISGGEMKRLAFACEVLTNPPLLFCDEPTSGLDSYMAQNVVETLKQLSGQGKTIVCTIHQPSSQVFHMFDKVLLMAEGRLAFLGPLDEAKAFFKLVRYPCPELYNPADHYVKILAVMPRQEEECKERIEAVCDAFQETSLGQNVDTVLQEQKSNPRKVIALTNGDKKNSSPYRVSWWRQFKAVLSRSWLAMLKEPNVIRVKFITAIFTALVLGVVYFDQKLTQRGVMNINGALFLMATNLTFQNLFGVVMVYCNELPVFLREHYNGMYRVDVYFICRQLAELPIYILAPTIFVTIYYWMVGFNAAWEAFATCVGCSLLLSMAAIGFGYFLSTAAKDINVAMALGPPLIIPLMLFGGYYLNVESIPDWLVWLEYLSWFRYADEILVINQWDGISNISCPVQSPLLVDCPYSNGADVIEQLGYDKDNLPLNWIMLAVLAIGFRIIAFLILLFKAYR